MNQPRDIALVLGAASPLGTAVLRQLLKEGDSEVIAADHRENAAFLVDAKPDFRDAGDRLTIKSFRINELDERFGLGLKRSVEERLTRIFYLAHQRNRTLSASTIKQQNRAMRDSLFRLAHRAVNLKSLVVLSDVGLIGDYPGRFSESWVNVGQIPFDEVDRSSASLETACQRESKRLPITRARVGLLSNLRGVPVRSPGSPEWKSAAEVLLPAIRVIKRLPRFFTIPFAVASGSLAPLTPTAWAAEALVSLSRIPHSAGKAFHLVVDPPPLMEDVLRSMTGVVGGARVKGGVPVGLIRKLGIFPGLKESARRQGDHLASWWTPHRYCLSRNALDISNTREILPANLKPLSWNEAEKLF
jgi:hypothetical protein